MNIIRPYVYVDKNELQENKLLSIERAARLCYKSEHKVGLTPNNDFISKIIGRGHESVIEHEKATVFFVVDRGVSHEIVRHRIASYSQESTRYCNYSSKQFGNEITVIEPFFYVEKENLYELWRKSCLECEKAYIELIKVSSPQEARSVLPNSLKTEIAVTFNMREWRHFFRLRCSSKAHPQMQQVSIPLLLYFQDKMPVLFNDIEYNAEFYSKNYAAIKEVDLYELEV